MIPGIDYSTQNAKKEFSILMDSKVILTSIKTILLDFGNKATVRLGPLAPSSR